MLQLHPKAGLVGLDHFAPQRWAARRRLENFIQMRLVTLAKIKLTTKLGKLRRAQVQGLFILPAVLKR
ncbi:hypothetical protein D3C76_1784580 [compost metagenome]